MLRAANRTFPSVARWKGRVAFADAVQSHFAVNVEHAAGACGLSNRPPPAFRTLSGAMCMASQVLPKPRAPKINPKSPSLNHPPTIGSRGGTLNCASISAEQVAASKWPSNSAFKSGGARRFPRLACRGFRLCQVMCSLFGLHWFEVQKENGLTLAVFSCAVRHPHELRARPCRVIRAKRNRIAKKFEHLVFWLAVNIKPAVQAICRHCEPRKPAVRTCQDAEARPRVHPSCRCQIRQ